MNPLKPRFGPATELYRTHQLFHRTQKTKPSSFSLAFKDLLTPAPPCALLAHTRLQPSSQPGGPSLHVSPPPCPLLRQPVTQRLLSPAPPLMSSIPVAPAAPWNLLSHGSRAIRAQQSPSSALSDSCLSTNSNTTHQVAGARSLSLPHP